MMVKTKLAKAVAMTVAGTALSFGAIGNASAHNMYNTFVGSADSATDGWVYGNSYPTPNPGFTGVAAGATPFGYAGKGWVNWAAAIHHAGVTEISDANAGFDADLDTNKGSWNDSGNTGFGTPQGWAHNTDIGLIKADSKMNITLNISNVDAVNQWTNFGITVFEGMDTNTVFANHHGDWNVGWTPGNDAAAQNDNPFGMTGLKYLTHSATVDAINGLTFTAEQGKVYSIFLGGNEFGSVFGPTADYKLNISSVSAVPVPGAVWLFGSALAGLVGVQRRKQQLTA